MIKKSFAKLNLCLHVGSIREDSYHPIQSVFQQISLHDVLEIHYELSAKPSLIVRNKPSDKSIHMPVDGSNILYKVFNYFKARCQYNYDITVTKQIPMGSGMGGASSNAAIFLKTLNDIEAFNYSESELCDLASQFGADVPFFIRGGTVKVEGIGERLTELPVKNNDTYIIVYPNFHCSTKAIYHAFDTSEQAALSEEFQPRKPYLGKNDLLKAVLDLYPHMKAVYQRLLDCYPDSVYMTGSGSTFFIPVHKEKAINELNKLTKEFPDYLCHIVDALS